MGFSYTNYIAYRDPKALGQPRIGHLDIEKSSIQPLSFASGAPLLDLYQVIEIGESHIEPAGEPFALSSVELLAPIGGRDILAVGKNYFEHAIEFNTSGYDSSDVCIFTKQVSFSRFQNGLQKFGDICCFLDLRPFPFSLKVSPRT